MGMVLKRRQPSDVFAIDTKGKEMDANHSNWALKLINTSLLKSWGGK